MGIDLIPILPTNVVAIIPARGGSKGLPKKNILPLAGRPLINYTIEAAKDAKLVSKVIVSTDDEKIREIALGSGAEVPFLRPPEYSTDQSKVEEALKHAVVWLKENEAYKPDIVVYLQVTDLFRQRGMIDKCVQVLMDNPKVDSAFMGLPVHKNFWRKKNGNFVRLADDIPYGVPRQEREPLYREDTGVALATRYEVVMAGKRLGKNCQVVPYEQEVDFIDIHSEFDMWLSEVIMNKKEIIPNK